MKKAMTLHSNPHEASPKIGVLLTGGRKSLGGQGLSDAPMKLKNILAKTSLKSIGATLGMSVRIVNGRLCVRPLLPRPLWSLRLSAKSSFCRAAVQSGLLTHRQMVHAAWRYRLGRSKDDAVIYWQMDQLGQIHDGKLMWYGPDCHRLKHRNATWVLYLLKQHFGIPQNAFQPTHCLFGLHLLTSAIRHRTSTICIVEAEKSAVILSELYPQYTWLAPGGLEALRPEQFFPLRHHKVVLFPDTDADGTAFRRWYQVAQLVMRSFFWPKDNSIRVSGILELHATDDQKRRKIDLIDFLFEKT